MDVTDETYACGGNFAWIGDEEDDSNHSEVGMPFNMFLSDSLYRCFDSTFSETEEKIDKKELLCQNGDSLWLKI